MPLVVAWLIGEGILGYRWAKKKAPPPPGAIALASGIFLGCALIAQYQPARTTATVFAYGVDLAVLLNVLPGGNIANVTTNWPPPKIPQGQLLPGSGTVSGAAGNWASTAAGAADTAASAAAGEAGQVQNFTAPRGSGGTRPVTN